MFATTSFAVIIQEDALTQDVKAAISEVFQDENITWIGHNVYAFDNPFLALRGFDPPAHYEDTLLMSYSIYPDVKGVHGLKNLARTLLGVESWEESIEQHGGYAEVPPDILAEYAARDGIYNAHVFRILREKARPSYEIVLRDVARMIQAIITRGIRINEPVLAEYKEWVEQEIENLEQQIRQATHKDFNPRSSQQVAKLLFEDLGLPVITLTEKGRPSVAAEVLEALAGQTNSPILHMIKDHRSASKVLSTYLKPIEESLANGRARPILSCTATVTGRLAGGIWLTFLRPEKNRFAHRMRDLIVADEGNLIVYADYSQAELRVAACESGDAILQEVFQSGKDPHGQTASIIFGADWKTKPNAKELRSVAKQINFLTLYGGGAHRLIDSVYKATGVKLSEKQANSILNRFYSGYSDLLHWIYYIHELIMTEKAVETQFGRIRRFGLFHNEGAIAAAKREGVNFVIQSTTNDLNLLAATRIEKLPEFEILLLVHDSIIAQVPEDYAEEGLRRMIEIMESLPKEIYSDFVPFVAEGGIGKTWGEAAK